METIAQVYDLDGKVAYWNVDRDQLLTLRSLFEFLQEAAIKHADQCGAGSRAKEDRGETWVLRTMAVSVHRYPHYEEPLRVATWSSGIRGFKGFRDFRAYCGGELVASASSVWLYINLRAKAIGRVPAEVAKGFPSRPQEVFRPDLERLWIEPPGDGCAAREVSVRYSDFDGNGHVNNTAYVDFLQTALEAGGYAPRPLELQIEYLKEIPPGTDSVTVRLEARERGVGFALASGAVLFAKGTAA